MKQSQLYGGSRQEVEDVKACYSVREKAIANGFTVRREKRGKETVLIITPNHLSAIASAKLAIAGATPPAS